MKILTSQGAPVANNKNKSDCLHLKVNLKDKFYLYYNSTTQRCSNKIIKAFLVEDTSAVVHLEQGISPQIFKKNRNNPNRILRGLGELIRGKKLKSKISWQCSFKMIHSQLFLILLKGCCFCSGYFDKREESIFCLSFALTSTLSLRPNWEKGREV